MLLRILRLTAYRAAIYTPILAPEGYLLEHLLEDGARSGVPRRPAGNRSPREALGPRPPGTMTRMRGARCDRSGSKSGEGSAGPEPKIATVERREASVPRTKGRKAPHKRLACRVKARRTGASHQHPYVSRCSAHPSFRVSEAKSKTRAQKTRRGNEESCAV